MHALVQFKDGKRTIKTVVQTKDIKGFKPCSSEDFHNRTYQIKWQQSFCDDGTGLSDDGFYDGNILVVGATLEEVRLKTKAQHIRGVPDNLFPREPQEKIDRMKKPLIKTRRSGDDDETKVKKNRMSATLEMIENDQSSGKKRAGKDDDASTPVRKKPKEDSTPMPNGRNVKNHRKRNQETCDGKSDAKANVNGDEFPGTSLIEVKSPSPSSSLIKASENGGSSSKKTGGKDDDASTSDRKKSKEDSTPMQNGSYMKKQMQRNQEMCEGKLGAKANVNGDEFPGEVKSPSSPPINACEKEGSSDSFTNKGGKKRAASKSSPTESDGDFTESDSDDDDVTVLFHDLKKKYSACSRQLEDALETIAGKKKELQECRNKLNEKRDKINTMSQEIKDLKTMNCALQKQLFINSSGPTSPNLYSPNSSEKGSATFGTPVNNLDDSGMQSDGVSPNLTSGGKSAKKKLFSGDDEPSDLAVKRNKSKSSPSPKKDKASELKKISERIEDDLSGRKPLEETEQDKVYVGLNTCINKKFWEKIMRKQKADSKFLKDAAQAIWGTEKLKVRNIVRATKDRPCIATPLKVQISFAMLRGKMAARGLTKEEQDKVIEEKGSRWLGEKMYDSGRESKKGSQK